MSAAEKIKTPRPCDVIRVGKHLYGCCARCGSLVKLTGFWKGIHVCD